MGGITARMSGAVLHGFDAGKNDRLYMPVGFRGGEEGYGDSYI